MRTILVLLSLVAVASGSLIAKEAPPRDQFAPRGKTHIAIGIPNTNDRLKTFVEPEGCFSPGVGSYGIYFWATDPATGKLVAPTMDGVKVEHGLSGGGLPIPWSKWSAGSIAVKTELCHVNDTGAGTAHLVAARAHLTNTGATPAKFSFFAVLRPIGPAGFAVKELDISDLMLRADKQAAIYSHERPTQYVLLAADDLAQRIIDGKLPPEPDDSVTSPDGNCSGAVVFELTLKPGETKLLRFTCPVLPGRRVLPHQWDGVSTWAQFDLAPYNPREGGTLQQEVWGCYFALDHDELFDNAKKYWKNLVGRSTIKLPDPRWAEALSAITAHAALCMNDGAPDVAVVNYNVFNRDGVYVTNILQKAGRVDLAEKCIDYFLAHPFNGRVQPEADNPGQILWIMGQHWMFSRDQKWLERVYPPARKIAAMIRYYRTTPEPHFVWDTRLEFGDALPKDQRKRLKPGACDGTHPEYTEAFDIAGLRAAAVLAGAMNKPEEAKSFSALADELFKQYDAKFGKDLAKQYGSYCVLWPCELYEAKAEGRRQKAEQGALDAFGKLGPQKPSGWRYFPLARAHQSLLAGNREAGFGTIRMHLDHEQMRGFYAFDEGGKSGAGGWKDKNNQPRLRTTWNGDVAMPHGWAIAELHLLIRDSLVFEAGNKLVLLAGVPAEWFKREIRVENLPTRFGVVSFACVPKGTGAEVTVRGATPPGGIIVRGPGGDVAVGKEGKAAVAGD